MKRHQYRIQLAWTGNLGHGTPNYRGYGRSYTVAVSGKPVLLGSSDPAFLGDPTRYNPEELLVASLSSCHMLWYLHLCSEAGISVLEYEDEATGTMTETDGFVEVTLHPRIVIEGSLETAEALHEKAHEQCFIAKSVKFPVSVEALLSVVS